MIRQSNGDLHYLINGLDQGIAAKVPTSVWGVIDLYGMTVKVTIVDRDEREEQNLVTRRNTLQLQGLDSEGNACTGSLTNFRNKNRNKNCYIYIHKFYRSWRRRAS